MPPIELSEFLERFQTLLSAAGPAAAPGATGLAPPMAALDAGARSFADVYGPDGRLLAAMSAASDDPGMAGLLLALERALQDGALDIEAAPKPAPRLTSFVYPVV